MSKEDIYRGALERIIARYDGFTSAKEMMQWAREALSKANAPETFEQPMLTVRSRGPLGPNDVIVDATELVKHVTFRMSLKIPADANAQKAATEKREPLFGESIKAELQRVYGLVNHWYEETQRLTRERDEARRDCLNFKMHGNIAGAPESGSLKALEQQCTCLCPFDRKPGRHHSLSCPLHIESGGEPR